MMRRVQPAPDFVFAGGDWVGHIPEARSGPHAVLSAAVLLATMLSATFKEAPVVHTVGNHDTWPYYSLAPAFTSWDRAFERAEGVAYVERHFPGASRESWRSRGYYARRLAGSLWAISLNTNELAKTDGGRQLDWLISTLSGLRAAGERAFLLGHIPPGPSHFELDSICLQGECGEHGEARRSTASARRAGGGACTL